MGVKDILQQEGFAIDTVMDLAVCLQVHMLYPITPSNSDCDCAFGDRLKRTKIRSLEWALILYD